MVYIEFGPDGDGDYRIEAGEFDGWISPSALHPLPPTTAADAAEVGRLREALERIKQWADAYPLTVFPEPNFKRAAEVLATAGMTLDAISASNMRHCVEGVGKIARAALTRAEGVDDGE